MKRLLIICSAFIILLTTLVYNRDVKFSHWLEKFKEDDNERGRENDEEEGEETDKPNELMLYQSGIRTRMGEKDSKYRHGYLLHELRNAIAHRKRFSKSSPSSQAASIQFNELGPNNVPGRTTALLNLPNDPNQNSWLAGAATGGIWKTIDGGNTWTSKGEDFPALPISSFALANDNTIYVGTGEHVSTYSYSAIGAGIFKSTDFGESWTSLINTSNDSEFAIITRLIVDPNNSNVIIASCVPTNTNQKDNTSSIMKSTDGGTSWIKAAEVVGSFEQVVFTPGNFNIQYASQNDVGVWKSIDAGSTWSLSNSGMYPIGRSEIAVSPVNPNYIYVASESAINGPGSDLYLSKDAGNSWAILDLKLNTQAFDFLGGQGFYDNVIICDPFNQNVAYFGGVNLFQTKINGGTSTIDNFKIVEVGTTGFLNILFYNGIVYDRGRLTVGSNNRKATIEVRFGPGMTQKAHRFLVPQGRTGGVSPAEYTYQDYVDVPFEIWDVSVTPNKQLMISFRDQNRNGSFDLLHRYPITSADTDPLLNSREYLFINDVVYDPAVYNSNIGVDGGAGYRLMYSFFPALAAADSVWNPLAVPTSKVVISYEGIPKLSCSTQTVADAYFYWDGKNQRDQANLSNGVHPDHHAMIPVVVDATAKTFKLLIGNDGGVFVTKTSTAPGTKDGDFIFSGKTLNTGQFYSADKSPGIDQYFGGMQDNGTRVSPVFLSSQPASFNYGIGGDGFEVLWNSRNPKELLGSVYFNQIYKSKDGGASWNQSYFGIDGAGDGSASPFYTKLSNSKDFPDRVFAVGGQGVYKSDNFGTSWQLTPISSNFSMGSTGFMDVEVSRASANIIWAGSGMYNGLINLHVSTDGGATFNKTNNFADLGYCTKLASHPTEPSTAYALFSFSGLPKILRTTDLGVSWQDITGFNNSTTSNNGFPNVAVFCLYVHSDNPDIIWAGTEIGIVESLDNGASWSLIPSDQFPHVSVFDMKGQDNQVIIATNGRGIWTANIGATQMVNLSPAIIDFGTSPFNDLELKIKLDQSYDSLKVIVDNKDAGVVKGFNSPGTFDMTIKGVSMGTHSVYLVAYKNAAPVQSAIYSINQIDILTVKDNYTSFFENLNDVYTKGFKLAALSSENSKLCVQSDHNYLVDKTYIAEFTHPIKISATQSTMVYSDLAIVATGTGKDSIIIEGSSDGLNWKALAPSYNASSQPTWNSAYLNSTAGNNLMYVQHTIDLKKTFKAGDVILIRARFSSDHTNTAWGYALDYVFIQVPSIYTAVEKAPESFFIAYPNPSNGEFTLKYNLTKPSDVSVDMYDMTGRRVFYKTASRLEGTQFEEMNIPEIQDGHYLVTVTSNLRKETIKVVIRN